MSTSEPQVSAPFTVVGDGDAGLCEGDVCEMPSAVSDSQSPGLDVIEFSRTDGSTETLADHAGQVVLVVNVASKCGLTPQYEALQSLYATYRDRGFSVLAFPANDFMGQEPGTDAEIADFCSTNYAVTFPILAKISVLGPDQHPLYAALTSQIPTAEGKAEFRDSLRASGTTPSEDPDVLWNFEKFLISRDSTVVARFAPGVAPDDPAVVAALHEELAVQPA